jgi:CP family cyanate transporter-like MFS transporter
MKKTHTSILILGILLLGAISRAPTVALGPLLPIIQEDLNMSYGATGFIVTLPVVIVALASMPISKLLGSKGVIFTLSLGLSVYGLSLLIRSFGGLMGLFLGSAMVGLGMCFINVLIPAIIKDNFPLRVGPVTSFYTTMMYVFAALSSALAVPVAKLASSWQVSLSQWFPLIILCLILWLTQKNSYRDSLRNSPSGSFPGFRLIRVSPLARWITVLMVGQAFIYYGSISWLPTIVQSAGYTGTEAGFLASVVQLCGIPGAIIAGIVVHRFSTQQIPCMIAGCTFFLSSLFMAFSTSLVGFTICAILLGFSMASSYTLFLCVLSLRAKDSTQAAELTGIVFLIGYLVASIAPLIMGTLYDLTHTWTIPIIVLMVSAFLYGLAGFKAGKEGEL